MHARRGVGVTEFAEAELGGSVDELGRAQEPVILLARLALSE